MLSVRLAEDRGHATHGWLDTYHSFSFADYYDPRFNGFRDLRVLNEDRIAPAQGFGAHAHRDMEILTYVLEGTLEHRDSLGNGGLLIAGEVQHLSAGRGMRHSEVNPSPAEPLHLLQIWLMPNQTGGEPRYAQKRSPIAEQPNRLHLLASPDGREGSLSMLNDARLYCARLTTGETIVHTFTGEGFGWLQVARGQLTVNGLSLQPGDALAISLESKLSIAATEEAEFLLFDLP